MHDERRPARAAAAPRALRGLVLGLALALMTACGGGAGITPVIPAPAPPPILDGLAGTVSFPDMDLGRIVEQEPNDSVDQPFQVAPAWARCTFEVTGELGTTAARYGRADPFDVFGFTAVSDQRVSLTVTFTDLDPIGGQPNELAAFVRESGFIADLATSPPSAQPAALSFDATAGVRYDVILNLSAGHAAYVARFELSDPVVVPKPGPRRPARALRSSPSGIAAAAAGHAPAPGEPTCASTHLLVRLRAGVDADAFCARRGLRLGRRLGSGSYCVGFDTTAGASGRRKAVALCATLSSDPDVEWADPDWIVKPLGVPNDREFNRQWNMRVIGAPSAWDVVEGDPSIEVAVIDTGVVDHPDLAGQTVAGYDFISDPAFSADGDGRDADPTDPGDGFDKSGLSVWHGTHVAGIIAARRNDAYGVGGLASGCRVVPIRVIGVGGGLVSDAADAILWIAGLFTTGDGRTLPGPLRIGNLSLGLEQDSPELRDACNRAANQGVFLVGAAGNNGGFVLYPARYSSVFAVAAVDGNLSTTAYSSFGPEIEISAPGGLPGVDQWCDGWMDGVFSCVKDETAQPVRMTHAYLEGTSQAAPHVAAAAALMLSLDPSLMNADLSSILRGTALDLAVPGDDPATGAGLLRVHRAVASVLSRLGTPRNDAAYLMLPTTSLQFEGFRSDITLPLYNGGGGILQLSTAQPVTDDGAAWLDPSLVQSSAINPPVNPDRLRVQVDRSQVPATPGRYSGSVLITSVAGTVVGSVRVILWVQERARVGVQLPVVAMDSEFQVIRRQGDAVPERDYRYFLRGLPADSYLLRGSEDLDLDGVFCESFEACGWHGGPVQADAIPVEFVPGAEAIRGLGIDLLTPP